MNEKRTQDASPKELLQPELDMKLPEMVASDSGGTERLVLKS